ncbi:MAG: trypsin-like peptidase domain-containing protein [Burkholderiaceae bacterium]
MDDDMLQAGPALLPTLEPALFSVARASTFAGTRRLTGASGFFFERESRLFYVTSRHVLFDEPSGHHPDRLELAVHTDPVNLTRWASVSLDLYAKGKAVWRQGRDAGGEIDVAAIELDRAALPAGAVIRPLGTRHLPSDEMLEAPLGSALLVLGFPLGFYDTLHNLPVARNATVASAFGVRFQGQGCFLTDARMHRGSSGAPVMMRHLHDGVPGWKLLGIHSARFDMITREVGVDDTLGLNCAWYPDILRTLTQ